MKMMYNSISMDNKKYYILKNTYKGSVRYCIAFPDPENPGKYSKISILRKPTFKGRGKGPTTDDRAVAEAWAALIMDREEAATIKASTTAKLQAKAERLKGDDLETFLTGFWTMDSDYVSGKIAEGRNITESYVKQNLANLKTYFLKWAGANDIKYIGKLTRADLLRWRQELLKDIQKKGLAASKVNAVRLSLHVPLNWAWKMGKIQFNPLAAVGKVKESPKERPPFEREELDKLFSVEWVDAQCKAACMLMAYTGLRIGEASGLQYEYVHLDEGYLDVIKQWQEGRGLCDPKWGHSRLDVFIPDDLIPIIKQLRTNSKFPFSTFVFPGAKADRPLSRTRIATALRQATKVAGIPEGRSVHSFRHGYAAMLRAKIGEEGVRLVMGHTSIKTTRIYSSTLTLEEKARNKNVVNGLFKIS